MRINPNRITEIEQHKYNNGVTRYQLKTGKDTFIGWVNKRTALKFARECQLEIIKADKTIIPLNFVPIAVGDNMIQYYEERGIH